MLDSFNARCTDKKVFNLSGIIVGNLVGRSLCHVWYDEDGQDKVFYIEKLKRSKTYVVAYWKQYDDAEGFELTKYELGADIVCGGTLYIVVMKSDVM